MNFINQAKNKVEHGYGMVSNQLNETINSIHQYVEVVYHFLKTNQPWHDVQQVMVTQREDMAECCCPIFCEGQNIYEMQSLDAQGNVQKNVGMMTEESGCFMRFCCQQFRAFKLKVSTDLNSDIDVVGEKPCKCFTWTPNMCCAFGVQFLWFINGLPCLRPEIFVTKKNQYIGKVLNPYRVCGRGDGACCPLDELDILDANGNMKYMISGTACQCGQIARTLCCCCRTSECCNKIKFSILDATKNQVGEILNVYNGCFAECCTKQDKFVIRFPPNATYNEKVLLLHAAVMIDFDIFEDSCFRLV